MKKIRIGIVGTGAVGTAVAMNAVLSGIADEILLMDRRREKAEAEAMDICHAITFQSRYCYVHAGEYSECCNLDLIVITAAAPLVQGQTRLDMLDTAKKITASIVPPIMKSGFDGQFIVITNPVDIISYYVYKLSGLPSNRVIGTGNALDSARLRTMLSNLCGANMESIQAYSVGEHGDSQFIPWSTVSIGGKPFADILADEKEIAAKFNAEQILFDVKDAGWKIARVKNTTNFGIAATTVRIMKAILYGENIVLPVSTYLNGQYGQEDVYLSVPAVRGANGICDLIHLHFDETEQEQFDASGDVVREYIQAL